MIRFQRQILMASSIGLLLSACATYRPLGSTGSTVRPADWTETSHSKNVSPQYDKVFPQDKVNRLDIKIEAADWKLMQDNMTELFGAGGTGPGGFPGPRRSPGASGNPDPNNPPMPPEGFPSGFPSGAVPSGMPSGFPSGFPMRPPGDGGEPPINFAEEDPIYRPCKITFEGKTWEHVGIRYKGNSSLRSSWGRTLKMPFRFDFDEFEKDYPQIEDQRFYGFKRLTLSSGFTDNSLIREKVAADIFREGGVPSAQTSFYRIYVDYGQGSKYFGLYTMVEAPDKPMLQTQFKNAEGNLYKPEGTGAKFVTFDQKSFVKKSNESSSDWKDIEAVFSALHASRTDAAKWRADLEKVFDMSGYLNYLAINTLIQNWDTYGRMSHNYYLYSDPSDGKVHWIPWDNNMALSESMGGGPRNFPGQPQASASPSGSPSTAPTVSTSPTPSPSASTNPRPGGFAGGPGGMGRGALSLELSATEVNESWPMIRYIIDDPVYHAQYVKYVQQAMQVAFDKDKTLARYQKALDLIKPYVVGPEGEQSDATLLSSPEAFNNAFNELKTHLEKRHSAGQEFVSKYAK